LFQASNQRSTITIITSKEDIVFVDILLFHRIFQVNMSKILQNNLLFSHSQIFTTFHHQKIFSYSTRKAICRHPGCGPIFGRSHDIYASNRFDQNTHSYKYFPYSYSVETGKGNITFIENLNFSKNEINVFMLLIKTILMKIIIFFLC
jgi:hypothetical protein